MGLISRRIPGLNLGVATIPPHLRLEAQCEELVNAIPTLGGWYRRQPTEHVAKLMSDATGYEDGFTHLLELGSARYVMVVANGDLKVFDADTGVEQTVVFPDGKAYLTDVSEGFRAVALNNAIWLLNRAEITGKDSVKSPAQAKEAIVAVRQGGVPEITYSIGLVASSGFTVQAYTTPDSAAANFETDSTTDFIADSLYDDLVAVAGPLGFSFELFGSTIYISRADGESFVLEVTDGLGDEGMDAIKGSVQRFEDLPKRAKHGTILEVVSDETETLDNFWVVYNDQGNPEQNGVWEETVQPGLLTDLDASTMPHRLVHNGPYFTGISQGSPPLPSETTTTVGEVPGYTSPVYQFDADYIYPGDIGYTVSLDGLFFTYTPTEDETGSEVQAGVRALIEAHANYVTFDFFDAFGVYHVDEVTPIANPFASIAFAEASNAHFLNADMVTDAHVGRVIRNISDGSTATITSNDGTVVTSGALSGGVDNLFQYGDEVEIVEDEETYFIFQEAPWESRDAGNDTTNPFPSFIGKPLTDLFVLSGRLGVLSEDTWVLSQVDKPLNFFRQSARQLFADDVIDGKEKRRSATTWRSAVEWNGDLFLGSDRAQAFITSGEQPFTPTTIKVDSAGAYSMSVDPRPLPLGESLFFTRNKTRGLLNNTQIGEFKATTGEDGKKVVATELTVFLPTYLIGEPRLLEGDAALGMLLLATDVPNSLYLFVYHDVDGQRVLAAWSRWDFAYGTHIIGIHLYGGVLRLVVRHSDGIHLEKIPMAAPEDTPWWRYDGEADADGEATPL